MFGNIHPSDLKIRFNILRNFIRKIRFLKYKNLIFLIFFSPSKKLPFRALLGFLTQPT
jgi:hypothetical protein